MYTTIKITDELKKKLDDMKLQDSETYAEIIEDMIEDRLSLNSSFIVDIENRRKEYKKGKVISLDELTKQAGS